MKNATLYIDQYGNIFHARTVKELRAKIAGGGSRVQRVFVDSTEGKTLHIGYVIGGHWLTAYAPVSKEL